LRKFSTKSDDLDNNPYRFGIGIELIDNNILSGPDIERVVNRQMIGPESTTESNQLEADSNS
jgi:hypothetical protein